MKRTMKRIALLLTVMCLAVSLIPCASAKHFYDVPSSIGEVYLDAINYVSDNGIMGGTGVNQFSPEAAVSRGMMVMILYRLSGDTHTYYNANKFIDVPSSSYYYNAIGWAVANGIAGGTSENTFEPEKSILREQLMTMLYRFAGYLSLPQDTDEDLTRASDYSSLSSYAYTPMSWAYEYGIVARGSLTERIWPISVETRKNTALYISRFLRNVEGIVYTRDAFSFNNSGNHFLSDSQDSILLSDEDWDIFMNLGLSEGASFGKLYDIATAKWGGSCYGMAVATVLDYYGKIDFNGNYCNGVSTMYDIPSLKQINSPFHQRETSTMDSSFVFANAESKINLYHISMHIPSINEWKKDLGADAGLREMVSSLEHSGVGIFGYSGTKPDSTSSTGVRSFAHAVVAYGKPKKTSTGYEIAIYDNRTVGQSRTLYIRTLASGWTGQIKYGSVVETIKTCIYRDEFSAYSILDIDGYDNTLSTTNEHLLDNHIMLTVNSTGDFTVTNAEGESFNLFGGAIGKSEPSKTNSSVSNDMPIYGLSMIPEGDSCTYLILTTPSDTFTCNATDTSEVTGFYAEGANLSFSAVASSDDSTLILHTDDSENLS